jgi:formylglycine-generating enzyme required for sulfatase activity
LQLLPGPTDRDGLPDSIRFWKTRIEELDADTTFAVGLIYGPSGCGKSSLVKAGLLPRLAEHVLPVYLEATSDDTEARLSKGLRKACPDLSPADLVETLASLRRGRGLAAGQKLLIVLDQFEQWLHAHRDPNATELVRALRHCDGCHIQCIVMVRDDFWLAASRFMDSLEIRLVQGQNSALVDLFDTLHAHKVLALFGRAFGRLPDRGELPTENEQFLDQAVSDLAEDSKVVSVRLSLFAEMVKGKPWTPATLVEIGGIAGVGATFLEETFSASTAPPRHRLHQKGARAVLKTLLPEAGADIKGHRRSATELLAASGYERRPTEFAELLRILDAELRLVTPADEETKKEHEQRSEAAASPASDAYQLTHDYLVPSLRDWLTRKQRETHRGRAEMRLAERSAAWNAKPDTRFLPSWWEWPNILLFTRRKKWTVPERRVMRAATRHHGARLTAAAVLIAIAAFAALEAYRRVEQRRANDFAAAEQARAETFAENVFTARAEGVPYALDNLRPLGHLAVSFLRARLDDAKGDGVRRLHAAYALADNGQAPWEYLMDAVPTAPAAECRNLVAALAHESELALPELARRAASTAGSDQEARYAIVALHLGDPEPAMDALEVRSDPIHRTTLIHGFAAWHGDLELVAKQLAVNDDGAFRSGICAAFGTIAPDTLQLAERDQATKMLLALYTNAPDGGTHSAAGWALRQWQQDLTAIARSSRPNSDRRWFVNRQGMTLIEIAAGKFMMGWEGEPGFGGDGVKPVHEVTLSKPFYLGDREITVEQFQRFMDDAEYPASEKPEGWPGVIWGYCPWPECPVLRESWFAAVLYCNWLSTREGRKPCYERTGVKEKLKNHDDDSEQEYDVWRCDFAGDGYRLPTEAEWEFACRAGTGSTCKYFYGNGTDLLTQYAWFHVNPEYHTWPGGMKLPNAFGLFDMYGNVDEWCWDWISDYTAEAVTDPTGPTGPTGPGSEQNPRKGSRMVRGGAFQSHAYHCFSAHRFSHYPMTHGFYVGFRVLCGR